MTTFAPVLAELLRTDPGRPLVTYYDHATGERVELSVTTYANWVAKTASLLVEEYDLERGQGLHVDLPTHWLGPVFLGAAWTVGLVVTTTRRPRTRSCAAPTASPPGPSGPGSCRSWPARCSRWACASPTRSPRGCTTSASRCGRSPTRSWPGTRPGDDDLALPGISQGELWKAAAAGSLLTDGGRLFTEANPASPPGIATLVEPLARGGSLVLVSHADPARLDATYAAERATARFPAQPARS